ncbi:hypothetical protein NEOLEDRAFT_380104 [Neolentinus lepideus HHB14362 ss-1]|uniref:Uncharacterized protein n=1 Tax=Neolentinus lepideus HHB14362 ss-1 TaxID=1314782 RepID=A0A165SCB4_9AGAM|nr:hypothetical protein NEOLEDRAFT_380104 [Neolentinus lepideus HHB14362 ss-1]
MIIEILPKRGIGLMKTLTFGVWLRPDVVFPCHDLNPLRRFHWMFLGTLTFFFVCAVPSSTVALTSSRPQTGNDAEI